LTRFRGLIYFYLWGGLASSYEPEKTYEVTSRENLFEPSVIPGGGKTTCAKKASVSPGRWKTFLVTHQDMQHTHTRTHARPRPRSNGGAPGQLARFFWKS